MTPVTDRDRALYVCRRLAWNALTRLNGGREIPGVLLNDLDPPAEDVEFVERYLKRQRERDEGSGFHGVFLDQS